MIKKDIVKILAEKHDVKPALVKKIVQGVLDMIMEALIKEGRIELRNFGVFSVKTRKERKARNPRTQEEVFVATRRVVTFKPGRLMKQKIK